MNPKSSMISNACCYVFENEPLMGHVYVGCFFASLLWANEGATILQANHLPCHPSAPICHKSRMEVRDSLEHQEFKVIFQHVLPSLCGNHGKSLPVYDTFDLGTGPVPIWKHSSLFPPKDASNLGILHGGNFHGQLNLQSFWRELFANFFESKELMETQHAPVRAKSAFGCVSFQPKPLEMFVIICHVWRHWCDYRKMTSWTW